MDSIDESISVSGDIENFNQAPGDSDKPDDDGDLETYDENAYEDDGTASDEEEIGYYEEDFGDDSDGIASEDDGTVFDDEEKTGDSKEGFGGDVVEDDSDTVQKEECFTVLKEGDIRKLQEADITQVSNFLLIPRVPATILLRHYNWNFEKAQDAWFADEEKVRKDVGLLENSQVEVPIRNIENAIICPICLDEIPLDVMFASTCGHLFCDSCWTQYASIKITDGPECLKLRCPHPCCAVAIGQDIVNKLVSDESKEKYGRYLYRSYVEDKKNIKWCPGPGCEFAVDFIPGSSSYDLVCSCGHSFCWNCVEDAHRPVDCDTVHNWVVKNSSESENVTWILANSKGCPKCKKPIEKNEGCMHMTCSCGFHFCWLCLGDWSTHGESTGGFYACNVYEQAKAKGKYDEEEEKRQQAKEYLDRYAFYYQRFAENQKSRIKAVESLQNLQSKDLEKLRGKYFNNEDNYNKQNTEKQLEFITNAWLQIIECRRVLKWTYVYGFYLPASEHAKKELFEDLQGQAECALERLHRCAEVELKQYLPENQRPIMITGDDDYDAYQRRRKQEHDDKLREDFKSFQPKLLNLIEVTKKQFKNQLVRALENGLSDVNSEEKIKGIDMKGNQ